MKETFTHTPSYDMSPAMLNVLVKMMLAQARECVFEQIGLSGIRNEFFTLIKMTQEVAKVKYGTFNLVFKATLYSAYYLQLLVILTEFIECKC